ncbi:MAG: aldehyde ferredoxin oxidoreductase N-terminal domain-containing protein, partial [Dehalococcoidia bacterium]
MNKIAHIDLSQNQVSIKDIPEKLRRLYLGGRGINMYLLYNYMKKGVHPLSPGNAVIFGPGLLTGMHVIGAARYNVSGRSPHSGLIGDSNAGGFFGPELRFAGFDHLMITGKAERPTYLWVHDGEIEFRDASHLEDYTIPETLAALREEMGDPNVQMAIIGPAGRRQVIFANVMNSVVNANGHTGMGAVMGSKNLWAVVVRGTQGLPVHDPQRLYEVFDRQYRQVLGRKGFKANAFYGT